MKLKLHWVDYVIMAMIGIIIILDIILISVFGAEATISYRTYVLTKDTPFPFLATFWGTLPWHFFGGKPGRLLFARLGRARMPVFISVAASWLVLNIVNIWSQWAAMAWLGENPYVPMLMGVPLGLLWFLSAEEV